LILTNSANSGIVLSLDASRAKFLKPDSHLN
jgi:hypothetical protein